LIVDFRFLVRDSDFKIDFLENTFFDFLVADISWDLRLHFRRESDGDCTSETLRGQSHKIGATEEITATDFRQIAGAESGSRDPAISPLSRWFSLSSAGRGTIS